MNRTLIFLTIFIILCIYTCYSNNIETFAVDASTKEEIKKAVNETFTADVDAIRNLSEVAIKLQAGGLILPGDGSVRGKLTVDGDTNVKNNLIVGGSSNFGKAIAINGAGSSLQLYGTGPTSHTYMEFYPDKSNRRAFFGFPGDNSKTLTIVNEFTDGNLELGNSKGWNKLIIDKDGNTTINGNATINGTTTINGNIVMTDSILRMLSGIPNNIIFNISANNYGQFISQIKLNTTNNDPVITTENDLGIPTVANITNDNGVVIFDRTWGFGSTTIKLPRDNYRINSWYCLDLSKISNFNPNGLYNIWGNVDDHMVININGVNVWGRVSGFGTFFINNSPKIYISLMHTQWGGEVSGTVRLRQVTPY